MKNIKYIIKRIIIGVGIALVLGFLRGNILLGVQAKEISSYTWGTQTTSVAFTSNSYSFNVTGNPWSNWRYGYLYFTFSTYSWGDSVPIVRSVVASSDTANYICHIGSISSNQEVNQTQDQNTQVYSAYCPMDMGTPGLTKITFNFQQYQSGNHDNFTLNVSNQATFESTEDIVLNQSETTNAINNQTTTITNNQNQNTQQQIESQLVCSVYDSTHIIQENTNQNNYGQDISTPSSVTGLTDFIPLSSSDRLYVVSENTNNSSYLCFFNINKSVISCIVNNSLVADSELTIPSNTSYVRFSINKNNNRPTFKICKNGNQALADQQQQINNTLNDDNVSDASSEASSFFDNFNVDSHGISGVITAPLRLLNSLTTASCTPLTFQLPFVHDQVTLPCMKGIYQTHFGIFFSLWQLITTGLISYNVCLNFYKKIHDLEDPNNDRIEVLNL